MKSSFVLFMAFFLVGTSLRAQVGRIEKVKDNKAVVVFPEGIRLSPGTMIAVQDEFSEERSSLRQREHIFFTKISTSKMEADFSGGGISSSTNAQTTKFDFGYAYNFINWEAGIFFRKSTENNSDGSGSKESSQTEFGVQGRFNIIENSSGNDWIPYLGIAASSLSMESSNLKMNGNAVYYGLGLMWFPLSEIFAFDIGYELGRLDLKTEAGVDAKMSGKGAGVTLSWRLVF